MKPDFRCFKNLKYVHQPKYSYWCWAACLEQMIKGLNANSKIGELQCELAGTYKAIKENTDLDNLLIGNINNYKNNDCCNNSKNIDNGCNVALEENDLNKIFSLSGFAVEEIQDLSQLEEFDFIKSTLINSQSPIVLKVRNNGYAHMNIISGFGELKTCKYVLISDPLESIGETYQGFSNIVNSNNIERAWVTKLNEQNLEHDTYIEKSIEMAEEFIKNNYPQIVRQNLMKRIEENYFNDPWKYLMHKDPSYIAQSIKNLSNLDRHSKKEEFDTFFNNLTIDYKKLTPTICDSEINKDLVTFRDINFIKEIDLDQIKKDKITSSLSNKINRGYAISYIKDYATSIQIKIEDNVLKVKPINYPLDYNIIKEWTEYEAFKTQLSLNPMVIYFNEEDRTRPTEKIKLTKQ